MMPSPRALVANMLRPVLRALEGQSRAGPWHLPISGGWLPANVGDKYNWWQSGYDPVSPDRSAIVRLALVLTAKQSACVLAIIGERTDAAAAHA
jgi:hypothetical protein